MSPRIVRSRRHARVRSLRVLLAMLILGTGSAASLGAPSAGAATPATVVATSLCAQFDPNLVSGACVKYEGRSGVRYTWIGTYRASNGNVFYCIDYLYDSRISTGAKVSTADLRNQLNKGVGAAEVAALNYLISTRAPTGSAGSAQANAAIALIIRQVMGDGINADGTVVYPPGLKVGGTVKTLPGGTTSSIMSIAQSWWSDASKMRGPWTVTLDPQGDGQAAPIGQPSTYALRVMSAGGRAVSGAKVAFTCTGPITCPEKSVTTDEPLEVSVTPQELGEYVINASVSGPSAQGQLLQGAWATHGGNTAKNNGVQRGWIAQQVSAQALGKGAAAIVKATPDIVTRAQSGARPGDELTDEVTVSGVPAGYRQTMTANLYGPFDTSPGEGDCTDDKLAGAVTVPITGDATFRTPAVKAERVGYYVWTESLPGEDQTNSVTTPCGIAEETTLVQAAPQLETVVTGSKSSSGTTLSDKVMLRGSGGVPLTIAWTLLGPLPPVRQGCADLDWVGAPVAAKGELETTGDGDYQTLATLTTQPGCYTYVEKIAERAGSAAVQTRPGIPEETALVLDWPALHTVASAAKVSVPGEVFDTITVTGVRSGAIEVIWRLLGPLAPGARGCADLDWSGAAERASGTLSSGTGDVRTPTVPISLAGCYTFAEHANATPTSAEADSPPGLPEETMVAMRPPMPVVPEVPTGAHWGGFRWLPLPSAWHL